MQIIRVANGKRMSKANEKFLLRQTKKKVAARCTGKTSMYNKKKKKRRRKIKKKKTYLYRCTTYSICIFAQRPHSHTSCSCMHVLLFLKSNKSIKMRYLPIRGISKAKEVGHFQKVASIRFQHLYNFSIFFRFSIDP